MSIYSLKTREKAKPTGLNDQIEQIRAFAADNAGLTNSEVTSAALATESLQEHQVALFSNSVANMTAGLEKIAGSLGHTATYTRAQIDAGVVGGMISGDIPAFFRYPVKHAVAAMENMSVVTMPSVTDAFDTRTLAVESYDEKPNRDASVYTVSYNMQVARQDDFSEAFFKTIVVPPDQIGYVVDVRLVQVYDDLKRNVSGAFDNFGKRNIIRAMIDPTILKNDQTKVIPVVRAQSVLNFVDPAIIAPRSILNEGEAITTAPLKMGAPAFNLIDLSQTDTLLANGVMDRTDALDPTVALATLYVKAGDDILKFNTQNLPTAPFTNVTIGLNREMNLNFRTASLLVNANTKLIDGSAPVTLAAVAAGNYIVRLSVNVNGNIDLQTSGTSVFSNNLRVDSILNTAGEKMDLTVTPALDIVTIINAATVIGYDLYANRTNSNKRQRGQLVDTVTVRQVYNVPLRGPVSVPRPVSSDGSTDSSDLLALINITHARCSNSAVGALLAAGDTLADYVDSRDTSGLGPDTMGIGRHVVRAAYFNETLDVLTSIDSLSSHNRAQDIQQLLVSKIRDMAFRLYSDSGYKPAADQLAGGYSKPPVVLVGTDTVIVNYIMRDGDLRTLGANFDIRVVSTSDQRMKGKIAVTFVLPDGADNERPHPLQFGNMAYKPEVVSVLPISRNGATSKELTVQPSYLHIVNLPVLGFINVRNIPDAATTKIPLRTKAVV